PRPPPRPAPPRPPSLGTRTPVTSTASLKQARLAFITDTAAPTGLGGSWSAPDEAVAMARPAAKRSPTAMRMPGLPWPDLTVISAIRDVFDIGRSFGGRVHRGART